MRVSLKEYNTLSLNNNGQVSSARLIYKVNDLGTSSTGDILREVRSAAAATIEAATRDNVELVSLPHADHCEVAVVYVPTAQGMVLDRPGSRHVGDEKWTFEASEGEVTAVTALSQIATVDATAEQFYSTNVGTMIGWNGKLGAESACEGVGIGTPVTRLTCRRTVASATAQTTAFAQTILSYQRKVNTATFHGFAAGQVRFLGATIGESYLNDEGDELTDVSYAFALKANEAARTVGLVTIPAKYGWDYAWTITAFNAATGKLETVFGAVSRVYEYADLTSLGIGGA